MSKANEDHPRVRIDKTTEGVQIAVNFKSYTFDKSSIPQNLVDLFNELDDWTSFCIASIEHLPKLSGFGFFAADLDLEKRLTRELSAICVSNEETALDQTDENKRLSYIIHPEDITRVTNIMSQSLNILKAAKSLQRSNLSALIAEFEYFLLKCLNVISRDHPEFFVDDKATIPIGYFRSGKNFEEWQNEQIQKTISEKFRGSHLDLIDWIIKHPGNKEDINAVHKSKFYKDFAEICQRRNLLIHNGGIVNSEYLTKCKSAGFSDNELPKIGEQLSVTPKYLKRSAARIYLMGAYTIFLVAMNLFPKSKDASYAFLLAASHEFLNAKLTKMAERVIEFAEFNKKDFNNELLLKFAINKSLAKLFDPKLSSDEQLTKAREVLEEYDWSVKDAIFDLALACAQREFDNLLPLAKRASDAGLTYSQAHTWVVFKEVRKREGFLDCFPRSSLQLEDHTAKQSTDTPPT